MTDARIRIGELSRITGLSTDVIRAWERRYRLLQPVRTTGNFRLYSLDDVTRLRLMRHYLDQRIPAARAAELVHSSRSGAVDENPGVPEDDVRVALAVLRKSLGHFDEEPALEVLDRLLAAFAPAAVLRDVVLRYLHEVGERWECGEASIAQEHFASTFLAGWMHAHAPVRRRTPPHGRVVLACVTGERHALGLMAFGLMLRDLGWRVTDLGADAPLEAVDLAARAVGADAIVLASVLPGNLAAVADGVAALARRHRVVLGGASAANEARAVPGVAVLPNDPVAAAQAIARGRGAAMPEQAPQ